MADEDGDSPLDFLESLELRMFIDNGFPLGGEFSITLFDSLSGRWLSFTFNIAACNASSRELILQTSHSSLLI